MDKEARKLKRNVRKSENLLLRLLWKAIFVLVALSLQIVVFWTLFKATGG